MFVDLDSAQMRSYVVNQIQADIDKFCRDEFAEDPRTHLGASVLGHDCQAKSWSIFRWLKFEDFDGRMLRLFNRGHEEEKRFVKWLVGIGFQVREIDPETKKQYRIRGAKGHFGGSLDAMMRAPERYNLPHDLIWLGEFKTHNGKSFRELAGNRKTGTRGKGVIRAKPIHYRQMCSYGRAYNFHWGLYCAVNKDDDDLYFEIVKLDWLQADDLYRKAEGIVFSQTRPQKIAQTPSYLDCKMCEFTGICHGGEVPTKNCRSCIHAFPVDEGEWHCEVHKGIIPKDFIIKGCDAWVRIV